MFFQHEQNNPDKYPTINLDGTELICYATTWGDPDIKIFLKHDLIPL